MSFHWMIISIWLKPPLNEWVSIQSRTYKYAEFIMHNSYSADEACQLLPVIMKQ